MNDEPLDLARTFIKMLGTVEKDREKLIQQLNAKYTVLKNETFTDETTLAELFGKDPALPEKLWGTAEDVLETDWPRPFWLVMREELKQIADRRQSQVPNLGALLLQCFRPAGVDKRSNLFEFIATSNLVGLAFSGGGIRSATFNLGVLQALAQFGLLPRVDYLSTVSGGGYIGAWFTAWMHRLNVDASAIQVLLSPEAARDPNADSQKPIRFLRKYSNYLTPTVGLLSFDTWTMAAVYLRNLILNQLTLVAGFGALLILPRLFGALIHAASCISGYWDYFWIGVSVVLLITSVGFIAYFLYCVTPDEPPPAPGWFTLTLSAAKARIMSLSKRVPQWINNPLKSALAWIRNHVQRFCVWPLLVAISIASPFFWKYACYDFFQSLFARWFWYAFAGFLVLSVAITLGGRFFSCFKKRGHSWPFQREVVFVLVTGLVPTAGTCLLYGYVVLVRYWRSLPGSGIWHDSVWGSPVLLTIFTLTATLQLGLLGIDFPDARREWLSRLRAVTNLYTCFWLALFCASIYGPLLIAKLGIWVAGPGAVWIASTVASLLAGKSSKTGQSKEGAPTDSKLDLIAKFGPPVFLVGFLLLISFCVHLLFYHSTRIDPAQIRGFFQTLESQHWTVLNNPLCDPSKLWNGGDWPVAAPATLTALLAAAFGILVWRVDINEFSMHHFYKNRLVRCYLGATRRPRHPDAFTGFDFNDDPHICCLRPSLTHADSTKYKGPYPIVNATLNVSAGAQLAWQERQAVSFVFTPCYSGYDLSFDSDHPDPPSAGEDLKFCAYRKTERYAYKNGLSLGTAIAISGAAADPNQGYNTSPAVAFLMTVFDVRLGWWLGNPRKDQESKLSSPRFGFAALLSELFGYTNERSNFISLSDGGHFDNMGVYELIRRRCRFIILSDAEQDGSYTFGGLGMVIRKCRIDFGAEIDIDPKRIVPLTKTGRSDAHCAVGTITFADRSKGVLVYIKSSLAGDEPEDVLQYAVAKPAFPHESTAEQWFTESQFESYRKLGYTAALGTFAPATAFLKSKWDPNRTSTTEIFAALESYWSPINPSVREFGTKHTKTLNDLLDKIRMNESLYALGHQLFPNERFKSTGKPRDPEAEYFFCMTLLQLVEDIFFDFQLDRGDKWVCDPRIGGWMEIFKTWSNSNTVPAMARTWAAVSKTFRKDFQHFWNGLQKRTCG